MSSREISIWIDERWYDALTRNLKGDTLEERLEEFVDQMCNQLPEHEYERISHEIWLEQQERKLEQEASRKFAVFHLVENGEHSYEPTQDEVKYLNGSVRLQPNEIDVEGEVMWSHETLEFYVPVRFDADKVFGSEIATAPRDSYVNVYAYYNLEEQTVCDDLTVLLISDNGSEEEFKYKLTPEEKELFRERMNAVCLKCGADLDECRQEYLQEQAELQSPMMQM